MAFVPLTRRVIIRETLTSGLEPTLADLNTGEFGINTFDGKFYIKQDDGTPEIITPFVDVPDSLGYTPVNRAGDTLTGFLTLNADPTNALHPATKQYVDNLAAGLNTKESVRVATTANISTLSGLLTVDDVSLSNGDRVLVKNQTTGSQNGIYVASTGAWTRATDFDGTPANEVTSGDFMFIREGTENGGTKWVLVTTGTITIGTTTLTFTQFGGVSEITAGAGLTLLGDVLSIEINPTIPGSGGMVVPSGTTGARPGTPTNGTLRYNTSSSRFEFYEGGVWHVYSTVDGSPGGSSGQMQYNSAGSFGGTTGLTWNNATTTLSFGTGGILEVNTIRSVSPNDILVTGATGVGSGVAGHNITIRSGLPGTGNANSGNMTISTPTPAGTGVGGTINFETAGTVRMGLSGSGEFLWSSTPGTSGQVLTSNGSGSSPTWQTVNVISLLGYTPVNRAGDTMTGLLTLSGPPSTASHATTKQYVDDADGLKVNKSGDTMTGFLTLSGDPTSNLHAATKQYVDGVAQGLAVKQSVRAATTGNITLSGLFTVDGVSLSSGNRVLVKNQTTGSQNGIYVSASGAWARATDFDGTPAGEVEAGDFVFVEQGTENGGTKWVLVTTGTITIGTTALTFTQLAGGDVTISVGENEIAFGDDTGGLTSNVSFTVNTTTGALTYGPYVVSTTPGAIDIEGSQRSGTGNGGNILLTSGAGGTTSGDSGLIEIRTGNTSSGNTGNVDISSGNAVGTDRNAGTITIQSGTPTGAGTSTVRILTNGSTRLSIDKNGAWTVGASTGTTGQALVSNGSGSAPTWQTISASPGGSNTHVQYNSSGTFTGSSGFTTDGTNVTISGNINSATWNGATIAVNRGGTGATTASGAINNLLPSQTGNSGEFLTTDGTNVSWAPVSGSPGGSSTQIQFNDSGSFAGDADFTWDNTNNTLVVGSTATSGIIVGGGNGAALNVRGASSTSTGVPGGTLALRAGLAPTDGPGGNVTLTATNGAGTNRSGGNVTITAGTATGSGTVGSVALNTNATDRLIINGNGSWSIGGSTGTTGQALVSNGSGSAPTWQSLAVAGSNTQIQYNNAGSFGASANFTWNNATTTLTVDGIVDMKSFHQTSTAPTISSGTLTLNLNNSTIFNVTLNANITTMSITNAAASGKSSSFVLIFTADGTPRSVAWPASVVWPSGSAPSITSTNGKRDIFTFITVDAGTTWFGIVSGQDY